MSELTKEEALAKIEKLKKYIDAEEEWLLWCDYHGLACTGCGQSQTISVEALKTKTYRGPQYSETKATPYENYLKMVKEKKGVETKETAKEPKTVGVAIKSRMASGRTIMSDIDDLVEYDGPYDKLNVKQLEALQKYHSLQQVLIFKALDEKGAL